MATQRSRPTGSSPPGLGSDRFGPGRWFTVAWPVAIIFHLAANPYHLLVADRIGLVQAILTVAAIALIVAPAGRTGSALAVAVGLVHLVVVAMKMPLVGNHEILLALVALTVVLAVARTELARLFNPGDGSREGGNWFEFAAPGLRVMFVVAYGAMAFSKLNSGFLDPAVSCAVVFGDEMARWLGLAVSDSAAASTTVIGLTVVVETLIPILLIWPRGRRWGVVLGLVFHFGLALEPESHVWDFSSILTAMFLLFAAPGLLDRLDRRVEAVVASVGPTQLAGWLVGIVAAMWVSVSALALWWLVPYGLWLVYGGFLVAVAIGRLALGSDSAQGDGRPAVIGSVVAVMWIPVLLAALNGASPYLEWRSSAAFNMYANLHTAAGESNHLIVRRTLPVGGGLAGELNSVVEADAVDPLAGYAAEGLVVPTVNLERFLALGGYSNAIVTTGDWTGPVVQLAPERVGWWDHLRWKLGAHRAVDPTPPVQCLRYWGPAH